MLPSKKSILHQYVVQKLEEIYQLHIDTLVDILIRRLQIKICHSVLKHQDRHGNEK